ncbi:MAG: PIN domain-containing protein [Gammaproteobacteria bacterium]|nr:PIN domain-containing protein [Gammaproteobacteria bacterium]MDP2347450.1 PIN domain-containing protein [Gammaproteobacteria bacterium]
MIDTRIFLDSNILLYLQSADAHKANLAEDIARRGGMISVQVLNEVAHVMLYKFRRPWAEINEVLSLLRALFPVQPLTLAGHQQGLRVAERYGLSLYDAMIVASALQAECEILYSGDMHSGLLIENRLLVQNPFTT